MAQQVHAKKLTRSLLLRKGAPARFFPETFLGGFRAGAIAAVAPFLLAGFAVPESARAASSALIETPGGTVRLVTTGMPDGNGQLRGAIEIALKPGWKTYWRDPGDAGVPPQLDIARSRNIAAAEFAFPAPRHIEEGGVITNGYDMPVAIAVTFRLAQPDAPATVDASLFLGICRDICIPVSADLTLDPANDADNPDDAAVTQAAFVALPAPARPDFRAVLEQGGDALTVLAVLSHQASDVSLFVASADGTPVPIPQRTDREGKVLFRFEGVAPPSAGSPELSYTLMADGEAVSGVLASP